MEKHEIAETILGALKSEIIQSFRVLEDGSIEELFDSHEILYWTYEDGIDWEPINPGYTHLFETYESLETVGHVLWHLEPMILDLLNEGVEFDVWQGVVDVLPDPAEEGDEGWSGETECIGWYIAAKQVKGA